MCSKINLLTIVISHFRQELASPDLISHLLDAVKSSNQFSAVFSPCLFDRSDPISGENDPTSLTGAHASHGAELERDILLQLNFALRSSSSLASVLSDFGSLCSLNVETLSAVLKEVNIPLDEKQVADIIVMILSTLPNQSGSNAPAESKVQLLPMLQSADITALEQTEYVWNVEVVAEVLSRHCPQLNWAQFLHWLDRPELKISSELSFVLMAKLIRVISGRPMSLVGVANGLWENRLAQYNILNYSLRAPKELADFSGLKFLECSLEVDGMEIPVNKNLLCVSYFATLLALADEGLSSQVMEIIGPLVSDFPEYMTVVLASLEEPMCSIRSLALFRTLPLFTGLPGSRATSLVVMKALMQVNPDVLLNLCRMSLRLATTHQDILNIDVRLKSMGELGRRVFEEASILDLLSYWCVMSEKKEYRLVDKVQPALEKQPFMARQVLVYIKSHMESICPLKGIADPKYLMALDTATTLLRILKEWPSEIPLDDLRLACQSVIQYQHQIGGGPPGSMMRLLDELGGVGGKVSNVPPYEVGGGMDPAFAGGHSGGMPKLSNPVVSEEVEEEANAYFQRIYTSEISIDGIIQLLKGFKSSPEQREQDIFRSMIHNLFDEYRFFHKYPDRELQVTGELFGTLIQHQLVSSITLGIALRYVLEAIRKDPDQGGSSEKIFRFGKISLDQFHSRLAEWPQYCSHLIQVPHFEKHAPELFNEARTAVAGMPQSQNSVAHQSSSTQQQLQGMSQGGEELASPPTFNQHTAPQYSPQVLPPQHQPSPYVPTPVTGSAQGRSSSTTLSSPKANTSLAQGAKVDQGQMHAMSNQFGMISMSPVAPTMAPSTADRPKQTGTEQSQVGGGDSINALNRAILQGWDGGAGTGAPLPGPLPIMTQPPLGVAMTSGSVTAVEAMQGGNPSAVMVKQLPPLSDNQLQGPSQSQSVLLRSPPGVPVQAQSAGVYSDTTTVPQSDSQPQSASLDRGYQLEEKLDGSASDANKSLNKSGKMTIIDKMYEVNVEVPTTPAPPETVRDQIHFIVNNVAKSNLEGKGAELKSILIEEYNNWFSNYFVLKRITTQLNLHPVYLSLLDILDSSALVKCVLNSVFHTVTKLLMSPKISTSSSDRSYLRNLASWLGQITLARNRPLLQRRIDLKELLLWAYENGKLIAVCSFVAKLMEGCAESKVFKLPNPWLMSILSVMKEVYELEDLKMNIKFEVQVLCKSLGVRIEDVPNTQYLLSCRAPSKDRNSDFNVRPSPGSVAVTSPAPLANVAGTGSTSSGVASVLSPPPVNAPIVAQPVQAVATPAIEPGAVRGPEESAAPLPAPSKEEKSVPQSTTAAPEVQHPSQSEHPVIPYLLSMVVVNESLPIFVAYPALKRLVPLAVDRAIRDILNPVVDRSVSVACLTTRQAVSNDFATEPNEQLLRNAAHLMAGNLAGMMALITCKEPLRLSMVNHIRSSLSMVPDQMMIEDAVRTCSSENLELGCMLIEKAATEKSFTEVDDYISGAIHFRRRYRDTGQPFLDTTVARDEIYADMPEALLPQPGGLTPHQLVVYESFQKLKATAMEAVAAALAAGSESSSSASTPTASTGGGGGSMSVPAGLHALIGSPGPLLPSTFSPSLSGQAIPPMLPKALLPPAGGSAGQTGLMVPPGTPGPMPSMANNLPVYNMIQALESYQNCLIRVESILNSIMSVAGGRDVTLSMLGMDHEILACLREIILITQCTQANFRHETAMTFAESVFKRLLESTNSASKVETIKLEIFVGILEALRDACGGLKKFTPDIIAWLTHYSVFSLNDEMNRMLFRTILVLLLRAKLIRSQDLDIYFTTYMENGRNMTWVEFALNFVRVCVSEELANTFEFPNTFEMVSKLRPANATLRKELHKWLVDLNSLKATKEEQKVPLTPVVASLPAKPVAPTSSASAPGGVGPAAVALNSQGKEARESKDVVTLLLDRWFRVWTTSNDQVFGQYLQLMHYHGVLKSEDAADKFFRVATDLCVESCLKTASSQHPLLTDPALSAILPTASALNFQVMDALSKLFLMLVRLADKESDGFVLRVNLLHRILAAIARSLLDDYESKKHSTSTFFDQRPYFRVLVNMVQDFGIPDPKVEPDPGLVQLLTAFGQVFCALQPAVVPGFAFSWLQLVSHRCFLSHLLLAKGQKGWPIAHKLLIMLLHFLHNFLKSPQLSDPIRKLYRGTLRVLLVLLHDFPEFLCDYHLTFCDAIPPNCVQLRNLILSAFPRSMRLPDPFTPNLKVDLLQEMNHSPRLLSDYVAILNDHRAVRLKLDSFLVSKQPSDFPTSLPGLIGTNGKYNVPLLSAVVIYAGVTAITNKSTSPGSPSVEFCRILANLLDAEGRYHLYNIIANQLRYPNTHTHFFSCAILSLFSDADSEFQQEQITRILVERLIVHRPHPVSLRRYRFPLKFRFDALLCCNSGACW